MKHLYAFCALFLLTCLGNTKVFSQELHTHFNAASIANEADSFSGWTGSASESSISAEAYAGSYSIKIESPYDGWTYSAYTFPTTANEQYTISFYAKSASASNPRLYWGGDGVVENQTIDITSSNWTHYTKTVTAQGTTVAMNIYPGTPGLTGESVYIDSFSIIPQSSADTQAPTAPTLSSTAQSQTTVDLSWTAATDNVGVTGHNVYQDNVAIASNIPDLTFQATGLTAATAYDFKVRALDAAGNESADSNVLNITTDSNTGSSVWTEFGSTARYSGEVAVGTTTVPAGYKMAVDGKLITEEVRVEVSNTWPDYVFKEGYNLPSLEEIQKHIEEKGHLPNMPSAQEAKANGVELGEMDRLLLQKIEELTLYIIELKKENRMQQVEIKSLKTKHYENNRSY